jgi:riboflavin biosynthesis pyrimidine reductase
MPVSAVQRRAVLTGVTPRAIRRSAVMAGMRCLFPTPTDVLDDAELTARYAVPDRGGRPHLRLNFISSADGAVSLDGLSEGLQTPGDNRIFGLLRDLADVVMVGAGTVRVEGYGPLRPGPARRARRETLDRPATPTLAVVSGALDLDPAAELFHAEGARTVVITHGSSPADRRAALAEVSEVIVVGGTAVDLPAALAALAERGLARVLCEGGPHLFGALLAARCVDELCLSVSPLLAGPGAGRIIAGPPVPAPTRLELAQLLAEDGALFCRYLAR